MMSETIKTYREQTYGDLYQFRFVQIGANAWDTYILSHPNNPRGGRPEDTHILVHNKLCVTQQANSLERAIANALYWIIYFSRYIRTGDTRQVNARAYIKDGGCHA